MSDASDIAQPARDRSSPTSTFGGEAASTRPGADHLVRFYEDDAFLTAAVTKFVTEGLGAGDFVTIIATELHGQMFVRQLEAEGVEVGRARASGQLVLVDAHETLSKFMRGGEPDRGLFESEVGGLIAKQAHAAGGQRLRAYGEMVDVLWKGGERSAALHLEELWNDLQNRHAFTLLCAYAMGSFYKEPASLHDVCSAHTHVVSEAVDGTNGPPLDLRSTGLPPQYARSLAREIAQRADVERALRESLRELRQKEEQLRSSEEQLRDFLENATLGLHRVGVDGTILWANRAELDLLGYTADEYVGRPIADFHVDEEAIADILTRLGRGEQLHNYEARMRAKDGSIKHVVISSNVYSRDGKFIHTRCFTRDDTQRRKAEEALRQSQRQLQIVTDALPTLVSFIDAEGRYQFVSAAYERWFGHPKAEVLGRHIEEVVGSEAYQAIRPHLERALSGERVTWEAEVPYRHRGTRFVEATYLPQLGDDGGVAGCVALVADVTERKNFDRFRAAAAARAERLVKITGAIADAITTTEVLEAVVDQVAACIDASTVALWLVDDDGRTVRLARALGYSEAAKQKVETLPLDLNPSLPALDAIRRGQPIWFASQQALLAEYPHLSATITPGRSYRVSCLPLVSHGRTLGALGITIEEAREASEEERSFLLLVARYAGQAIERLRLLEAERRSRTEADRAAAYMGLLSRASRTFVEAKFDHAQRVEEIVRELGTVLDSCVGIVLLDAKGKLHGSDVYHPEPQAQVALRALVAEAPIEVGEGMVGGVVRTGESLIVPTTDVGAFAARAAPAYRALLEQYPVYAMICAPLRARGRVIGAVTAARTRRGETYTHEDLELLEELAERAASAIENSRLHRENIEARSRAEQLHRFAQTVMVAERVEEVFEAALDAIDGALGTSRAAILLYDADGVMRFQASRHLSDEYRRAVEGHSPWPRDAVAPKPVLISDVTMDPAMDRYMRLFLQEGIRALAFIPLVTRGRLIGKFMVYFDAPHAYSTNEIELASAIANHLASVTTRFAAIAKLEETIRYNELFAGVLAHDLRNPLGAMMTAAQLLLMRQEGAGDKNAKPLTRILASGQRMTRMIDQLLDFTRARVGGGIQVQPRDVNLADLCGQAIDELELAHPEWKIRLDVVGDAGGSWDPDRLLQILSNLLGNAGQHGDGQSGIVVKVDGQSSDAVTLRVHNAGVIPDGLLPTLFDPFRGTRHRRDQSQGLGLGLFIVKEILRAHGGTVDVSSSEAAGTTFTITLPRRVSRSPAAPTQVAPQVTP
jgi:PAS domain S-box-containing protein